MAFQSKPLGGELGWSLLRSSYLFESQWFNLRQDAFSVRNQGEGTYTYIEHPGSVFVVPLTPEGRIVLIRSYRFTIDAWCWEVPAGTLADRGDRPPEVVAKEELEEEIGASCRHLKPLGEFFLGNGFANHRAHFFLALDVELSVEARVEPFEEIDQIAFFSLDQIERLVREGAVNDGDSAFALLLALGHLAAEKG